MDQCTKGRCPFVTMQEVGFGMMVQIEDAKISAVFSVEVSTGCVNNLAILWRE